MQNYFANFSSVERTAPVAIVDTYNRHQIKICIDGNDIDGEQHDDDTIYAFVDNSVIQIGLGYGNHVMTVFVIHDYTETTLDTYTIYTGTKKYKIKSYHAWWNETTLHIDSLNSTNDEVVYR